MTISFNENFFSEVTTESSYWAGLMAADGCVSEPRSGHKRYSLQLVLTDECLVRQFHSVMESTGKVGIRDPGKVPSAIARGDKNCKLAYVVWFGSTKLCNDLWNNFGIGPRKSLTHLPPNIPKEFWLPYIKGYVDGDGYIGWSKPRPPRVINSYFSLSMAGTKEFLTWINSLLGERKLYHVKSKTSIGHWIYRIEGSSGLKVAQLIKGSTSLGLSRKWDKVPERETVDVN